MTMASSDPTYTVFIRLPFPRGNFVDPPPVNWDPSKDEALWNIVSGVSKTDIDWNEIAARFEVTVDFLLQQVAFLTERHTSQVRAQLRKAAAAAKGSSASSPAPGAEPTLAGEGVQRAGSALGRPRAPSALSLRKDSPLPRNDGSTPGTPLRATPRPQAPRKTSSNTGSVYTTRNLGGSGKASIRSGDAQRRRLSSLPIATTTAATPEVEPDPSSPGPADTSSAASSSDESSPAQSRVIRRPPISYDDDEDDEDDDEPAFLPYRAQKEASTSGQHDLSATLRGNLPKRHQKQHGKIHLSQTSDSSASSAAPPTRGQSGRKPEMGLPLSPPPRRTQELSGRSPIGKGKGYSRDSDGTPSMGSSFSDLDDASVTQSALEEALASRIQDGGIGSRMSTISNVFRSRYLPKSNNNP
ncbi:hypothetical protein BJ166DRAFT_144455 [Pestalotiopsis sp. NC0098]|nr:hypothetical protein BJ166DRAFT_144455 [Pestalotiopsis sp. NC0098]